jgi:hypothetical protein
LVDVIRQRPAKVFRAYRGVMQTTARPSRTQPRVSAPEWHPVLPAEAIQGLCCDQRCGGVSPQDFEARFP